MGTSPGWGAGREATRDDLERGTFFSSDIPKLIRHNSVAGAKYRWVYMLESQMVNPVTKERFLMTMIEVVNTVMLSRRQPFDPIIKALYMRTFPE